MWYTYTGNICCLDTKLFLTLCDPRDCSLSGSSVHGISQARILKWVAFSFSMGSSWPRNWARVSCCRWIFTNWAISFGAQTPMCEHIFQHLSPSLSHWEQGSARAPEKRPSPARLEGWGSPAYVARLGNSSSLAAALGFSLSPGVSNSQNSASCPSFYLSSLLLR